MSLYVVRDDRKRAEVRLGVLAVQGAFIEHMTVLRRLGVEAQEVRLVAQLEGLHGLIIPGGESTTIARLMDIYGLRDAVAEQVSQGMMGVFGTCAGMILMAKHLADDCPQPLGLMDIEVVRNGYGRQVDSFEADLPVTCLGDGSFPAVFIRSPVVSRVGDGVEVLASLPDSGPVAVRQGKLVATAFHPELTGDTRFHRYFLDLVRDSG